MKQKIKSQLGSLSTLFIMNPVVVRDLRAQMRGTKSYWFQGAYLLLLGLLAIAGYAQATQQWPGQYSSSGGYVHHVNIVDAQSQLETLYYFIFGTLGVMILLIAPALTAASIVGERQRLSFDLLVTTPLRATELLVGKLVSSIAFLGLLLSLSVPASALCVLLGGATLGDVFRVYTMLAIDGVVLAAVGLFFSCASKTNLLAVMWTYASVAAYFIVTMTVASLGTQGRLDQSSGPVPMSMAFGALNPIMAITQLAQSSIDFGHVHIPIWLASLVPAFLCIRLLITAATYRLGAYGRESGPSLRRQALLLIGVASFVFADGWLKQLDISQTGTTIATMGDVFIVAMIIAFIAMAAFLPGLFVPVSGADAPVPSAKDRDQFSRYGYCPSRAFQPEHAGALPYFHIVLLTVVAAGLCAMVASNGLHLAVRTLPAAALGTLYVAGLGFMNLQIARVAANISRGASGARGLAFGIFALICVVPLMALGLSGASHWEDSWIACGYVFYPLLQAGGAHVDPSITYSTEVAAGVCYGIGVAFLLGDWAVKARRTRRLAAPVNATVA